MTVFLAMAMYLMASTITKIQPPPYSKFSKFLDRSRQWRIMPSVYSEKVKINITSSTTVDCRVHLTQFEKPQIELFLVGDNMYFSVLIIKQHNKFSY